MIVPEGLVPIVLRLTNAKAVFASEEKARERMRERALRPVSYAPPTRLGADVDIVASRTGDGWPVYTLTPRRGRPRGHVVYVHGGGWVHEIFPQHWRLAAQIAAESHTTVTVPIYPLVPYGTAAGAADGVTQIVLDRLQSGEPAVLAGDSAGGQIALSAALQLRDRHGIALARTVAISPAVDLTFSNPRIPEIEPTDPWLASGGASVFVESWRGSLEVTDPVVSPVNGDLAGLGPITVFSGTRDVLNPDAGLFVAAARDAGVDVEYVEREGLVHVFPLLPTRAGRAARVLIVDRIRRACAER
ncbi:MULTISPECIES: alpha/beta hydrolase fold domain-containing protein [unclassified Microbacterium]|uniref:alpha/beta hydrolase fold domain-containing protein n=1 Tax=unclassified Microbacterium TaxID=2609290 RepID=UPI00386EB2A3